jgi:hypothetical protein
MAESVDLHQRKEIARALLSAHRTSFDDMLEVDTAILPPAAALTADLQIPFPAGVAPIPQPITPMPSPGQALPQCDVVAITWTVAENDGMADVLTPGHSRNQWYRYNRFFDSKYDALIRDGAPAKKSRRLGSYFPTRIGSQRVLCFKSELHLNQDGIESIPGNATLPVKDLFLQIIGECKPKVVLTVGTCGGIELQHDLGDVLVTRAARFRCRQEFANAPFNNKTFKSDWAIPLTHFDKAGQMMSGFSGKLTEPNFGPPTKRHTGTWTLDRSYMPNIIHEFGTTSNKTIPPFHPILTTDFFEFGTSRNAAELLSLGCGLEMGDAVLGLATSELASPPKWAVIRNISDPQINGDITNAPRALNMQTHWAVWYYEAYGYWTSVSSALVTWAIAAGL